MRGNREQRPRLVEHCIQSLMLAPQRDAVKLEARRVPLVRGPPEGGVEFEADFDLADDVDAAFVPFAGGVVVASDEDSVAYPDVS